MGATARDQRSLLATARPLALVVVYLVVGALWFALESWRRAAYAQVPRVGDILVQLDPYAYLVITGAVLFVALDRAAAHRLAANQRVEAGKADRLAGISEDVSSRHEAEAEVRQLNADLERRVAERTAQLRAANRELEAFSYSVSHDLQGPLQTIEGFSHLLIEDHAADLDAEAVDLLERVRAASQRMESLLEALLGLSQITRRDLHHQDVDLSSMADTILQELYGRDPQRSAEVHIQPALTVRGDPVLLQVLLKNLLSNAWKFTANTEHACIEFGSTKQRGEQVLYVRDNGAGFDMQQATRLFKAFQRLHPEEEFEGTGIGLATAQRIVSRHGGRLWAEAEVGKGAAFYFTLVSRREVN